MKSKHTPEYEVSPDGNVYSVTSNWRGYGKRELVQELNDHGYPSVRIIVNGRRKRMAVHKLVANKYLPSRPSCKHEIRHLDGNKMNSNVENLAWGTRKENAEDRDRHGRTSRGKLHGLYIRRGLIDAEIEELEREINHG